MRWINTPFGDAAKHCILSPDMDRNDVLYLAGLHFLMDATLGTNLVHPSVHYVPLVGAERSPAEHAVRFAEATGYVGRNLRILMDVVLHGAKLDSEACRDALIAALEGLAVYYGLLQADLGSSVSRHRSSSGARG